MPELPDLTLYVERLSALAVGQILERVRLLNPVVLRSYSPDIATAEGRSLVKVGRIGKRLVLTLEQELHLVVHLMIAGRLRWRGRGANAGRRLGAAALDFTSGTLLFTEAGTVKRASLHLVAGEAGLAQFQRGGLEPLQASLREFAEAVRRENRTLKRILTDPRLISGVGNAYSDEILHRARLSPVTRSHSLDDVEVAELYEACRSTLWEWIERLRSQLEGDFPEEVTAFHEEMAVHGRYGKPCPVCGTKVQRIVHATNEVNYCPGCQTKGRLLADRSLSRLLGRDWPGSLEELEEHMASRQAAGDGGVQRSTRPVRRRRASRKEG
jgi:formamidopyrimidine-DNA glycosylase